MLLLVRFGLARRDGVIIRVSFVGLFAWLCQFGCSGKVALQISARRHTPISWRSALARVLGSKLKRGLAWVSNWNRIVCISSQYLRMGAIKLQELTNGFFAGALVDMYADVQLAQHCFRHQIKYIGF